MISNPPSRLLPALLLVTAAAVGCSGSSNSMDTAPTKPSDRFADLVDDDRETVMITPADLDAEEYDIMPATFDTVIVRAAPASSDGRHGVDALLKGSFPDGCTHLHEMSQRKTDSGQAVTLTMRRPLSEICTQVVRPYRFFFELDDRYPPGDFTLVVNDRPLAFVVE